VPDSNGAQQAGTVAHTTQLTAPQAAIYTATSIAAPPRITALTPA
jgi:hypothetical protein